MVIKEEDLILGEPDEDDESEVELIEDVEDQLKDDIQICQDTFYFLRGIESDIDILRFGLKEKISNIKKKCLMVILNNIDNLYEDLEEE